MEGKNGSVVLLLALVALCFYTGQSSARRSAIDFASLIQGEGKNGSIVLLLALVALCFYTGQSSARRSAIDFASPIEGGLKSAEPFCAVCTYIEHIAGGCFCLDKGPSCRENCQVCACPFGQCRCLDSVDCYDQCKSFKSFGSKAFVKEIMLGSTPTSAHG